MAADSVDGARHLPLDPDVDVGSTFADRAGGGMPAARPRGRRVQSAIVVAVALGGVVGAITRYAVARALPTPVGTFPWSTFLINVSGSVLLGFLLILVIEQFPRGRLARPVIGTGFCGAYTTFSTYMVDAVVLVRGGHLALAALYVAASALAGLAGVWAGITGARMVLRAEQWLQVGE